MVPTDRSSHVHRLPARRSIHNRRQAFMDSLDDARSGLWEFVQCRPDVGSRVVWNGSVLLIVVQAMADIEIAHFSQVIQFPVYRGEEALML